MRAFNVQLFDDVISGTSATWYSPAEKNELLGTADGFAVAAVITSVSGPPDGTLRVNVEHSCDGVNWLANPTGSPPIVRVLTGDEMRVSQVQDTNYLLRYVRFRMNLTGTGGTPQCRLKLYATGRVNGRAARSG